MYDVSFLRRPAVLGWSKVDVVENGTRDHAGFQAIFEALMVRLYLMIAQVSLDVSEVGNLRSSLSRLRLVGSGDHVPFPSFTEISRP